MSIHEYAKILRRRGGLARAENLPTARKKQIASLRGHARKASKEVLQRIQENFRYLKVIQTLQKPPKVIRQRTMNRPLPNI